MKSLNLCSKKLGLSCYLEKKNCLQSKSVSAIRDEWFQAKLAADEKDKLIILPHYGEFGFFVFHHLRYCYSILKPHLICCRRGQECLFPKASGFLYEWENPVPDNRRAQDGGKRNAKIIRLYDQELRRKFFHSHPDYSVIRPKYKNCWLTRNIKYPVTVNSYFPPQDIVVATRKRGMSPDRNLNWDNLIKEFSHLKIGIVGAKESSVDYGLTSAWQHPDGETAGTIDLLQKCKLFIGGDSGIAHLAAMLNIPSLVVENGTMLGMIRINNNYCKTTPTVDTAIGEAKRYLV